MKKLIIVSLIFFIYFILISNCLAFFQKVYINKRTYNSCTAFSPDGRYAISADARYTYFWDIPEGSRAAKYGQKGAWDINFSSDSRYAFSIGQREEAQLWDVAKRRLIWEFNTGHKKQVHSSDLSENGRYAITSCRVRSDNTIRLWNLDSRTLIKTWSFHNGEDPTGVIFRPRVNQFLSTHEDGSLRLWDADNKKLVISFRLI
ncbi:unnamed protein product, partial [marine sediment metagenome]